MSEVENLKRRASARPAALTIFLGLAVLLCGCCASRVPTSLASRRFDFQRDTFAFPNQLRWEYFYDTHGNWTTRNREPKPSYSQHCFVLARATKQFFLSARFEPKKPVVDDRTYRRLIRRVISTNPRRALGDAGKIEIPGYPDLHSFSREHKQLLKAECGGAWQSYFQRGHWRIVFPFRRKEQQRMAEQLLQRLKENRLLMIHLVRFPQLTINHALVLFDAKEMQNEIQFITYDPNNPEEPRIVNYDRARRTFFLAANDYFPGGRVDVYEVDHNWNY